MEFRDVAPIKENQMEKNIENCMETGYDFAYSWSESGTCKSSSGFYRDCYEDPLKRATVVGLGCGIFGLGFGV